MWREIAKRVNDCCKMHGLYLNCLIALQHMDPCVKKKIKLGGYFTMRKGRFAIWIISKKKKPKHD
jgi:lipoate-protein ligase B